MSNDKPFGFPLEGIPLAGNVAGLKITADPTAHVPTPEKLSAALAAVEGDDIKLTGSPSDGHAGLPVAGYDKIVDQWRIDMVNENKIHEERVLRRVDEHVRNRDSREIDQASVQLARRHVEDAFYRLNRAIMQPKRILGDLE